MLMYKLKNSAVEVLTAAISKVNFHFLWWNSSEQVEKFVFQGCRMDWMVAGMLEDGEDCASGSTVCTAPQSIKGRAAPALPAEVIPHLHGWECTAALLVKGSSLELTREHNSSACLSDADGCLCSRKLCLSRGGRVEELLVAYTSFWDTALLSCLCLLLKWASKTVTLQAHSSVVTGVLEKRVWCNSE